MVRPAGAADHEGGLELVVKVDAVLGALERRGSATAAELSVDLGEPLSSVYRLLHTLVATGWVERGPRRGAYRLGLAVLTVGGRVADRLDVRAAARPALRELRAATGLTAYLCVRRGSRAVCLERVEGDAVASLALQLGGSLPLFAGAAPRALLAFLPEVERDAVLAAPLEPLAGDPVRPSPAILRDDLAQVRRLGRSVSDGDVTAGVAALGAPVHDHRGDVAAALSVSGLRDQVLGADVLDGHLAALRRAAEATSAALGRASEPPLSPSSSSPPLVAGFSRSRENPVLPAANLPGEVPVSHVNVKNQRPGSPERPRLPPPGADGAAS